MTVPVGSTNRRRAGGRAGKQQRHEPIKSPAYLKREIPIYEMLNEEALQKIEDNADTILQEIGIDFKEDDEVLEIWRQAGCDVQGERVRFEKGMLRSIINATSPKQFTQHARNPDRSIEIGGDNMCFFPSYGSPFVHDLDNGRRYAKNEDFKNFIKLSQMSPWLHHSGGTIVEPMDLPVNKRHFDMVYNHIKYSDKCFMGSVTAPERAEDSIDMARIVFGKEFMEHNCSIISVINVNSPLTYDGTMLGALKTYARANQAVIVTPFILMGAMGPVTLAGALSQVLAEAMAGLALIQLIRPGARGVFGTFTSSMSLRSGAPTFGMPEPALGYIAFGQLAKRLGVPLRGGGSLTASKIPDAQAAQESADTLFPTLLAGINVVFQAAGWLEGGLTMGYEKFILDTDHLGMMHTMAKGIDVSENALALSAYHEVPPGQHHLGTAHTMANYKTAFYDSTTANHESFEQWQEEGSLTAAQRAKSIYKRMLCEYELPPLDQAIDDELKEYMLRRKSAFPDSDV
jgi:trimethylamine--corrinoid protein Co-methyltransferase